MHITNQKLRFDIQISSWNMILISNDFCHKIKMYNFEPYNVLLAIATNMTASVLQGHIFYYMWYIWWFLDWLEEHIYWF